MGWHEVISDIVMIVVQLFIESLQKVAQVVLWIALTLYQSETQKQESKAHDIHFEICNTKLNTEILNEENKTKQESSTKKVNAKEEIVPFEGL